MNMRSAQMVADQIDRLKDLHGKNFQFTGDYRALPAYFRNMYYMSNAQRLAVITRDVDAHFRKLRASANKRVGQLIDIKNIDGDYWLLIGVSGTVGIRCIGAGGYNIQRYHTRWVFDRKAI